MKEPGFYFYTGDWLKDPNLRRCSKAAKGCWIDMLAILSECPLRGVFSSADGVPWTIEEIAGAIGGDTVSNVRHIEELVRLEVASQNNKGAIYSRRMVRDEQTRETDRVRKRQQRSLSVKCPGDVRSNVRSLSEEEIEEEIEREIDGSEEFEKSVSLYPKPERGMGTANAYMVSVGRIRKKTGYTTRQAIDWLNARIEKYGKVRYPVGFRKFLEEQIYLQPDRAWEEVQRGQGKQLITNAVLEALG